MLHSIARHKTFSEDTHLKKVIIGGFRQESNSFNPTITTMDWFINTAFLEGEDILKHAQMPTELKGMMQAVCEAGATAIPSCFAMAQSGGKVDQPVVDRVLNRILQCIEENLPVDGIFLSLHGATQSTEYDDCCGYMLEKVRNALGDIPVIAVTTDLHANITERMVYHADIICGYQTYPHLDLVQTGYRAASLAFNCMETPLHMVMTRIPMIMSASIYTTTSGPFAELMEYAFKKQAEEKIRDFSIYQMQPWLDTGEGGSAVVVIDSDLQKAKSFAAELSSRQLELRHSIQTSLYSIDEVIGEAEKNHSGKPYILVDSADSPNAGATGDSAAVLKEILEKKSALKTAFALVDSEAADLAHRTGVANRATFSLGGTIDPERSPKVVVNAYVKSLHDGNFSLETPAYAGLSKSLGKCAVLQVGNIDILVCKRMGLNGDPQFYRSFGIDPLFYQLVVIKANTSFRAQYHEIAARIFETDTPGAAGAKLTSLPFQHLPHPFYPFDSLDDYVIKPPIVSRRSSLH